MAAAQAKEAWAAAPDLCRPTGCAWYHGIWPTLRLLGLVATPHRHRDFFARSLAGRAGPVLVCGAADAAMAEVVHDVLPGTRLTVLDRCATPVRVTAGWAARAGADVEPWVVDVFDADVPGRPGGFDAVCTHGLFTLVPVAERAALARRWASLLAPGGVLVTTSSLSGPEVSDPATFTADAVEGFAARARAAAQAAAADLPASIDEVVAASRVWAERAEVHPVRAVDEVVDVLGAAGLDAAVEVVDVAGPLGRGEGGPTSARSGRYLEIVATRR